MCQEGQLGVGFRLVEAAGNFDPHSQGSGLQMPCSGNTHSTPLFPKARCCPRDWLRQWSLARLLIQRQEGQLREGGFQPKHSTVQVNAALEGKQSLQSQAEFRTVHICRNHWETRLAL